MDTGVDRNRLPDKNRALYDVQAMQRFDLNGRLQAADDGEKILLSPGVYECEPVVLGGKEDIEISGYGAVLVMTRYTQPAFSLRNCKNIQIKGVVIDHKTPANTQGDVMEVGDGCALWRAHRGYQQDLLDSEQMDCREGASPPGELFRADGDIPVADVGFPRVVPAGEEGAFWLYGDVRGLRAGDRIVFRGKPAHVNALIGCENILFQDVTLLSGSGFGLFEKDGAGSTRVERMLITPGPMPLDADHPRLVSTCDATHSANMRRGISVRDSWFEKMTDDAANVHSYFAKAVSYDPQSGMLRYTYGEQRYQTSCAPFRKGDAGWCFRPETGEKIPFTALSDTAAAEDGYFCIHIRMTSPGLLDGMLIQNKSASGDGFCYENCLIDNNRSRGILVKASHGCIRGCTFRHNGMSAVLVKPEIPDGWGECGFAEDLVIENNRIEECGFFTGSELHSAINIQADIPGAWMHHRNIRIRNNSFGPRYTAYAVFADHVEGLGLAKNCFEARAAHHEELYPQGFNSLWPDDTEPAVLLSDVTDLEENGNRFPPSVRHPLVFRKEEEKA